jgi:hypothetical protein
LPPVVTVCIRYSGLALSYKDSSCRAIVAIWATIDLILVYLKGSYFFPSMIPLTGLVMGVPDRPFLKSSHRLAITILVSHC